MNTDTLIRKQIAISILICAILDALVDAPRAGWTSSQLSRKVTSEVQRAVKRGDVTNEEVMTYNKRGRYFEVTGAKISSLLAKHPDVTDMGVYGGVRYWALTSEVQKWARKNAEYHAARQAASDRVRTREVWDRFEVIFDDRTAAEFIYRVNTGWSFDQPVEAEVLPKAFAEAQATALADQLRKQIVQAAA